MQSQHCGCRKIELHNVQMSLSCSRLYFIFVASFRSIIVTIQQPRHFSPPSPHATWNVPQNDLRLFFFPPAQTPEFINNYNTTQTANCTMAIMAIQYTIDVAVHNSQCAKDSRAMATEVCTSARCTRKQRRH